MSEGDKRRPAPGLTPNDVTILSRDSAESGPAASGSVELPASIGDYRILGELGRGGMGVVYLAEDLRLERCIAIKVLPDALRSDASSMGRFEREARILAAMNHPNIATIFSLEVDATRPFITMERVPGETLAELIAGGPLSAHRTCAIGVQIAAALESAHAQGVIHRDLKPANVKVTREGRVKVLDFGLAKSIAPGEGIDSAATVNASQIGQLVGTIGYMSPEQLNGDPVDGRSDLWALGCMLYECLSGRRAFAGRTATEVIAATLARDPDLSALPAETPAPLHEIVENCLRKDPAQRPADAAAVGGALAALQRDTPPKPSPPGLVERSAQAPGNLPLQLSSFIGREQALRDVRELLPSARLLTITGTGGCGKTRLALEAAALSRDSFPAGTWIVELAALRDPDLLPQSIAGALAIKEESGRDLTETLIASLQDKPILLILDNCEHLLGACSEFAQSLLGALPDLRLVATSREALGLSGERVYPLRPLATPGEDAALDEGLAAVESVCLFLERLRAFLPDFTLDASRAAAVSQICRRLDGIPLALELAAARARVLSVEDIARRLDDRFRLLADGRRHTLPQHQTLKALIDWSYRQLAPSERRLFRRLSLFAGGWTLAAAEAIAADEKLADWEVLDLLANLVDKSLVEMDSDGATTRYRMLETLRAYAREQSLASGEGKLRQRYLAFYLALAEDAAPQITGPEQASWLARLNEDQQNFRAALEIGMEEDQAHLALRLAAALGRYWSLRGHLSEGRRLCEILLSQPGAREPSVERARVLNWNGNFAHHQGDFAAAEAAYEESMAVSRAIDDRMGIALALGNLGNVAERHSQYEKAQEHVDEVIAIVRAEGDRNNLAIALNNQGYLAQVQGQYEQARALHEESLALRRDLGDEQGTGSSLANLATLALYRGDTDGALAMIRQALAICEKLGDPYNTSHSYRTLGDIALSQGEHDEAESMLARGLDLQRDLGDKHGASQSLFSLGLVALGRADLDGARGHLVASLGIRRELDHGLGKAESLMAMGALAAQAGESQQAARLLGAAEAQREAMAVPLRPTLITLHDEALAQIGAGLTAAALDSAWREGRALSPAAAIELALAEP